MQRYSRETFAIYTHMHLHYQLVPLQFCFLICLFMQSSNCWFTEKCCHLEQKLNIFTSSNLATLLLKTTAVLKGLLRPVDESVINLLSVCPQTGKEARKRQNKKITVSDCHAFSPTSTHQGRVGRVSTTFGPN